MKPYHTIPKSDLPEPQNERSFERIERRPLYIPLRAPYGDKPLFLPTDGRR